MQGELTALRSGEIGFGEFQRLTHHQWLRFAKALARHWKLPLGVDVEDLVQEMFLAVWRFVPLWDASKGKTLYEYVRYNANDKAKKWLQQQRNTLRRSDKNPGRTPLTFTSIGLNEDGERWSWKRDEGTFIHEAFLRQPEHELRADEEEHEVAQRQALGRVMVQLANRDGYLLIALSEANGDVTAAAREAYGDARTRRVMRWNSEGQARKAFRRALDRAAQVAGAAT